MNFCNHLKQLNQKHCPVTLLSQPSHSEFESVYLAVRNQEKRLLDDSQVAALPQCAEQSPHWREWQMRQHSADMICEHIHLLSLTTDEWVLDIGCGNGWFSHLVAQKTDAQVLASDINLTELNQAGRVFQRDNLHFAYLDMMQDSAMLPPLSQIIFNSCFQYFPSAKAILDICLNKLTANGQIHIVDSPFYSNDQVLAAKGRSEDYYQQLNAHAMSAFYHHHSDDFLQHYNSTTNYQPAPKGQREATDSPFSWLTISR